MEGKWLHVIASTAIRPGDNGSRYWDEFMIQVLRVKHIDFDAGKTGRGIIHFLKGPYERVGNDWYMGHNTAVDIEDIVDIYDRPVLDIPTR